MKSIAMKIIAALSLTISALLTQSVALAATSYPSGTPAMYDSDLGFTLACVAAFASIVWLGVTTFRRTRYKAL